MQYNQQAPPPQQMMAPPVVVMQAPVYFGQDPVSQKKIHIPTNPLVNATFGPGKKFW